MSRMTLDAVLFQCLRHFVHLDESNAAIHCATVRYSPITFRLAEELMAHSSATGDWPAEDDGTVGRVLSHVGLYDEDAGR
jgi:hypothetical protein